MSPSRGFEKSTPKNKEKENSQPLFSQSERRVILIGITILLFVAAATVLLLGSLRPTPLQSCKNIVFQKQRYDCIYSLASATNNYSICSLLPNGEPSQCISLIAESQMNASACARLGAGTQYSNCIENVSLKSDNVSYCLDLNGSIEPSCAFNVARSRQFSDLGECSSIKNITKSLLCSYIYYYNAAPKLNMPNYCSLLPDVTNSTLLSIVETKDYLNQSAAISSQFITTSAINITVSASCYYNTAIETKNKTLCAYAGSTVSGACYDYLNSTSTNSTFQFNNATALCSKSPYGTNVLCYYALYTEKAVAQKNISSCFEIGNSSYIDTCIVELASTYNDSAYCKSITNSTDQQACYSSAVPGAK